MQDESDREPLHSAMKEVLASPSGKRVVFWLLSQAAIYRDAFSGDASATNYVLGQQSVGRMMIGLMDEIDPRTYPTFLLAMADIDAMDRAAAAMNQPEDDEDA